MKTRLNTIIFCLVVLVATVSEQSYSAQNITDLNRRLNAVTDPQKRIELLDEWLQDESIKGQAQGQLFFHRGLIYKNQKDYFKAIEDFDASLSISKRNYAALIEKAESLIMVDQLDQASLALDTYLLNMPGVARAYVLKGLIFEKEGSLIRAEDEFSRALNFDPQSALALESRARLYLKEGKPRKALEDVKTWSRISPTNPDLYVFRAEVQVKLRDYDSALNDYAKAESLRPDDAIRKQKTLLFLKTDKPGMALSSAQRWLEESPDDAAALVLTARCLIQLDRLKPAESILKKAMRLGPNSAEVHLFMGVLRNKQANHDEALEFLNRALELDPRLSDTYKERARIFVALNDHSRAEIDLSTALALDPSEIEILTMRGLTFFQRMLYDAAIQDFSQVLEDVPNDGKTLYNRAVCYLRKDDLQRALQDLDNLIKVRPDSGRAYNLRGVLHGMMGKDSEAISDLNTSTTLSPKDPMIWNNRGFFKYRTGNFEGAIEDFQRALKLNPQFQCAKSNLALTTDRSAIQTEFNQLRVE